MYLQTVCCLVTQSTDKHKYKEISQMWDLIGPFLVQGKDLHKDEGKKFLKKTIFVNPSLSSAQAVYSETCHN